MKRYYNPTTEKWYTEGQTITHHIPNGVFSGIPNESMLAEWGDEEWNESAPTPEQLLEQAKDSKLSALEAYDSSDVINSFRVNIGNEAVDAWFSPEQRANYKNSLDSAELLGMEVVHPVINGISVGLPVSYAKTALARIQLYADACFGTTEAHKAAIAALTSIEDVERYDFTTGYPERLVFSIP